MQWLVANSQGDGIVSALIQWPGTRRSCSRQQCPRGDHSACSDPSRLGDPPILLAPRDNPHNLRGWRAPARSAPVPSLLQGEINKKHYLSINYLLSTADDPHPSLQLGGHLSQIAAEKTY